ncbi:MAG: T9SS type A sorting domain-containing protein [Chitinophagales bacterium]
MNSLKMNDACLRRIITCFISSFLFLSIDGNYLAAQGLSISNLNGFHRNGQAFLTWQLIADPAAYYKVYRSAEVIPISNQLANCEYLGWTNGESSKDHNLSRHDGFDQYLVIDSGNAPLNSSTGLFVATTLVDGSYFYAVTIVVNGVENLIINQGINSLQDPIYEKVEEPQPIFQQTRLVGEKPVDIYATFISSKYAVDQQLMNDAGFITNDFALYRNGATSGHRPIRFRFHGGGADFLYNITAVESDEINVNPEHFFPNGDNSSWWGANENFDVFNSDNNKTPPTTGINYNFSQQQTTRLINWAIKNLPVDSSRIYLEGTSQGSIGAYFYAITNPQRIAAVKLSGSTFNLAFQNDYNPACTLNEGNSNRISGDNRFGTLSTNLMSNLGYPFYNMVNGNWVISTFNEKDYPVIYSINGKNDTIVGWTEKTIYYDAVNANHVGGYYFWDGRKHGGGTGLVWGDENFDVLRYRNNVSFPAFSYCSTNEDAGDGHASDGESFGTVNGFLDWSNDIADETAFWTSTIFMTDLKKSDGSIYSAPDMCTVDITPRRRQQFHPKSGDTLWWNVLYNNEVVQSGKQLYTGSIITVPQVVVYKEGVQFEITTDSVYLSGNMQDAFMLAYPNPFTQYTTIRWQVTEPGRCSLKVYDVQGRLINVLLDEELTQGIHQVSWNADNGSGGLLNTGVYLVRLETPANSETEKMMIIR